MQHRSGQHLKDYTGKLTNIIVIIAEQEGGRRISIKLGHQVLGCILLAAGAREHVCMAQVEGCCDAFWQAGQRLVHVIYCLLAIHLEPAHKQYNHLPLAW